MQTFSFHPPDLPNSPTLSINAFNNSTESVFPSDRTFSNGINHVRAQDAYRPMTADPNDFDEDAERNLSDDNEGGDGTDNTSVDNAYKTHEDQYRTNSSSPPLQNPTHNIYGGNVPYGTNMRNMRPMTAPSSISAPYGFQGTSFNGQGTYLYDYSTGQAQQSQRLQKDQMDMLEYRRQCYDLPGMGGMPGRREDHVLPDEPHRRDESPPPFLHNLPPLRDPNFYEYPTEPSPDFEDEETYSRPTTANERNRAGFSAVPMQDHSDSTYQETKPAATQFAESKSYNFIASAGQAPKRPRRRYDEIERLYTCDYVGCKKAYGTLNHLNSHKTMQKHGPKSTPSQFKELRKAWRDGKKAAAAAQRKMSTEALTSGRTEAFPRGNSPPLRRPVTAGGDFAYQVPNPFIMAPATQNWGWRDGEGRSDNYSSYGLNGVGGGVNRPSTAPSYMPAFHAGAGFQAAPPLPSHTMLDNLRRSSLPSSLPNANFYNGGEEGFENIEEEEVFSDRGGSRTGGGEDDSPYVPEGYADSS